MLGLTVRGKDVVHIGREKEAAQEAPSWEMMQLDQDPTIGSKRLPPREDQGSLQPDGRPTQRGQGEAP